MAKISSIYTFTESQIREMLIESDNPRTRRGLLKILDAFIGGSTFVFTVDEPTMNRIRTHFDVLEEE